MSTKNASPHAVLLYHVTYKNKIKGTKIRKWNKTGNKYTETLRRVRVTTVAVEKQEVLHILSVYVCVYLCVALVIQHALRLRPIILSSAAGLALPYSPTLSDKRHGFRKRYVKHKMCVLVFFTTFVFTWCCFPYVHFCELYLSCVYCCHLMCIC
jgi:hypothetical protein